MAISNKNGKAGCYLHKPEAIRFGGEDNKTCSALIL